MLNVRNIEIPHFVVIEAGSLKSLGNLLLENINTKRPVLLVFDEVVKNLYGNEIISHLKQQNIKYIVADSVIDSTEAEVEKLVIQLNEIGASALVGVGGGRTLDVGKSAASEIRLPFISIPTTASHDGIFSPVAVIKKGGKTFSERKQMPLGVIVDLKILKNAPKSLIIAGIGDTVSNLSALKDWKLSQAKGVSSYDDFAALQSQVSLERILKLNAFEPQNEAFLKIVVESLILNGVAMEIANCSLPCSGAEHMISHALDMVAPNTSLHGLQVAWATLVTEVLRGQDISPLKSFFKSMGIPTRLKGLGFSKEQFLKALPLAPKTRPDRYSILNEIALNDQTVQILEEKQLF